MHDLAITGGSVATSDGVRLLDLYITDGTITALVEPGTAALEAEDSIDATGMLVMPGGIDPHVHSDLDVHLTNGTIGHGGGADELSRAAIFGGTTTLIDFAWNDGSESFTQSLHHRDTAWRYTSFCDYSFHVGVLNAINADRLSQVADAVADGFPSFKIFTTNVFPNAPLQFKLPMASIRPLMAAVAASGGLLVVHVEDDDLVMDAYAEAISRGTTELSLMSHVHSTLSERVALARLLSVTADVDDARIYVMHVSAGDGVDEIAKARASGRRVWGETLHQYLLVNDDEYERPEGVLFHTYPSIKGARDSERLWQGIDDGDIVTIATDAVSTPLAWKMQGQTIDTAVGGNVGIEPRVALMYTEMVVKRSMTIEAFVDQVSTNASKMMGMYPQKGVIAVGSDADIAVLDIGHSRTIDAADLHESDYTPWQGREVFGWPIATVLRGTVAMRDGALVDQQAHGRRVARSPGIDPQIRAS